MDPGALDVKRDAKVNCYAAQNGKAVDKGPVGGVQRDLSSETHQGSTSEHHRVHHSGLLLHEGHHSKDFRAMKTHLKQVASFRREE